MSCKAMLTLYSSGLFAIKDYRDAVNQDDFNKAVRKVAESKKLGKFFHKCMTDSSHGPSEREELC